jgi:hypothetical protein
MLQCQVCKNYGAMQKCNKCNAVYCRNCAIRGLGNYPKVFANQCPTCGVLNSSTAV